MNRSGWLEDLEQRWRLSQRRRLRSREMKAATTAVASFTAAEAQIQGDEGRDDGGGADLHRFLFAGEEQGRSEICGFDLRYVASIRDLWLRSGGGCYDVCGAGEEMWAAPERQGREAGKERQGKRGDAWWWVGEEEEFLGFNRKRIKFDGRNF